MNVIDRMKRYTEIASRAGSGATEVDYVTIRDVLDEIERLRAIVDRQSKALNACKRELILYAGEHPDDWDDGTADAIAQVDAAGKAHDIAEDVREAQRIAQAQEPGETEGNWTAWIQRKKPR